MEGTPIIGCCFFLGVIVVLFLVPGIRIVPEHWWLVVYRLDQFVGKKGPGFVFLIPVVDRLKTLSFNRF